VGGEKKERGVEKKERGVDKNDRERCREGGR